jgi:transposase
MAATLLGNELWELIEPLLPKRTRRYRHPGRRRINDRRVLSGILFVLTTGIAWQRLSPEPGYGSGMTCWCRLCEWQRAGVWQNLHELCSPGSARPNDSTSHGLSATAPRCARFLGAT